MARRRKKSTQDRKPPLTFTESPVNIQNNVPSPVECARHPPTAASIPVDQLDNLSWVSPQFLAAGGSRSHTRQNARRRRLRPRGITSANMNRNASSSHIESNRHRLSKFTSLKFVGDPSTMITSDSEDVEVTESGPGEIVDHIDVSPVMCTNKRKTRQRQKFGKRLEEISANIVNDCDDGAEVSAEDTGGCNDGTEVRTEDTGGCNDGTEVRTEDTGGCDDGTEVSAEDTGDCDDGTEVSAEDTGESTGRSEANDSSVIEFTHVRRFPKGEAPVKRLFASQLQSCMLSHSVSLNTSDLNKENCPSAKRDIAFGDLDSDIETVANTESDSDTAANAGLRRSERLKMLRRLIQLTDSPQSNENVNILAPDTPESCYGWSIRRRQLKNYKRKR